MRAGAYRGRHRNAKRQCRSRALPLGARPRSCVLSSLQESLQDRTFQRGFQRCAFQLRGRKTCGAGMETRLVTPDCTHQCYLGRGQSRPSAGRASHSKQSAILIGIYLAVARSGVRNARRAECRVMRASVARHASGPSSPRLDLVSSAEGALHTPILACYRRRGIEDAAIAAGASSHGDDATRQNRAPKALTILY